MIWSKYFCFLNNLCKNVQYICLYITTLRENFIYKDNIWSIHILIYLSMFLYKYIKIFVYIYFFWLSKEDIWFNNHFSPYLFKWKVKNTKNFEDLGWLMQCVCTYLILLKKLSDDMFIRDDHSLNGITRFGVSP